MQESSYVTTMGFQMEQYLHGSFVATELGCMVTFIAPPGQEQERVRSLINASNAVGAHTVALVVEGESAISKLVDTTFALPPMPEPLTPIVYLAPLQLFTYWMAVELKRNPDVFRLNDSTHRMARQSYQL
jgi:glucosamine--fructose-6-phosphate aminotransferase (isomerizing)